MILFLKKCINVKRFLGKESPSFMISYIPFSLFSVPSLVLAFKLSSRQVPKSIFNQTSIFLFFFTGTNYFVFNHKLTLNIILFEGIFITLSLGLLTYIIFNPEQRLTSCSILVTIRFFFVYIWFNSSFLNVWFR